ncbi:flagella basal body P-ring formation protein FlgA [Sphingosinicella humi]|uniref:Flagellar protein n=1 Tax=Allosphingosinicella humi TaxID=2068657 RepID=A0A2U2J675_9SPHN|nr:flagella basal body P-ring formation protein FlgA [Sphingosinicella humi]PWG03817.1 flagellar protein [Sphingosinicella humi]
MVTLFRRLALLSVLCAAPAAAQGFEDLDMLESRLVAALGAGIGEAGGPANPIDRRLKLAACPSPAMFDAPRLGAATINCEPLGWRIRVPLARSASVTLAAAKAEPVIRRGDQVEVIAMGGAFRVSTLAVADEDGSPGERIRLRSDRKSAPIFGQVTEDGRVAVTGFN